MVSSIFMVLAVAVSAMAGDLIRRVASGDRSALRAVYRQEAGRAFALALRMLGSREDAEDVVQDTFLEVWRRAHTYDASRGEPGAWILAMARSRAIDRLRRKRVRDRTLDSAPPPEPNSGPDDDADRAHRGRAMRAALQRLPVEQRKTLELAYFAGLTQQEIAERTTTPLGTVKTRLRLALDKLSEDVMELR